MPRCAQRSTNMAGVTAKRIQVNQVKIVLLQECCCQQSVAAAGSRRLSTRIQVGKDTGHVDTGRQGYWARILGTWIWAGKDTGQGRALRRAQTPVGRCAAVALQQARTPTAYHGSGQRHARPHLLASTLLTRHVRARCCGCCGAAPVSSPSLWSPPTLLLLLHSNSSPRSPG